MTERAASSTAVLVCQGRATADGRYAVGRFSDPIARELLDPADRIIVDRVRANRVPTHAHPLPPRGIAKRSAAPGIWPPGSAAPSCRSARTRAIFAL